MSATPSAVDDGTRRGRLASLWQHRRPAVMGILNCTPDSFSDGGLFMSVEAAAARAGEMLAAGADIVDIGGESTRPGAQAVPGTIELARVEPVVRTLRSSHPEAVISVDTSKADVAAVVLAAGADLINDVTAASDAEMLATVSAAGAGITLMHMRGTPRTMQTNTGYADVIAEVHGRLRRIAADAVAAGVAPEAVWLDPGIGFGKDLDGNLSLLAAVPALAAIGHPVVVGASRKSFIARLTKAEVSDRLAGSLAALIPALEVDRAVVRVHDVAATVQFLAVASAVGRVGA